MLLVIQLSVIIIQTSTNCFITGEIVSFYLYFLTRIKHLRKQLAQLKGNFYSAELGLKVTA